MLISEEFPGKFLKAIDLKGRQIRVVIDRAEKDLIGEDRKLVLYFQGKERGLVCNTTNRNTVFEAYGDNTDDWVGKELILYPTTADFRGKMVDAIRVRVPNHKDGTGRKPPPQQRNEPTDPDDQVPF